MTRIDFYILEGDHAADRRRFACRLAEKAYLKGHKVYIHTADAAEAGEMDELLWSFRSGSFVPHHCTTEGAADPEVPVQIGCGEPPEGVHDVLVNLTAEVPAFFSRFLRLAEVVERAPPDRARARERFRFYRERGYPLQTHSIT